MIFVFILKESLIINIFYLIMSNLVKEISYAL